MSPPHLGVAVEGGSEITLPLVAAGEVGNSLELKEHNYMELYVCSSSVGSTTITSSPEGTGNGSLNLKATELRLGLPGSQSPKRDTEIILFGSSKLDEKLLFPLHPSRDESSYTAQKSFVSGNKRGFSDAMNGFSEGQSKFFADPDRDAILSPRPSSNSGLKHGTLKEPLVSHPSKVKDLACPHAAFERTGAVQEASSKHMSAVNNGNAPATKAQVVGWPPIRSFRKNSLATTSKNNNEVDSKAGQGTLLIKVSMDGVPYLRKVDLKAYSCYQELSSSLETMFSCFMTGKYASHETTGRENVCDIKLKDILNGSENVLTYDDKDDDWMLVGDVPWEMFIETCKRMRIMKCSDAIGLAPRSAEKQRMGN